MIALGDLRPYVDRGTCVLRATEGGRGDHVGDVRAEEGCLQHRGQVRPLVGIHEDLGDVECAPLVENLERIHQYGEIAGIEHDAREAERARGR